MEVSHADRVMFPAEGITKGELVDYYRRVAPVMVPHLRNRPLMLERYRAGIDRGGFYQKEAAEYFPGFIRRVEVPKAGGVVHHPIVDTEDALVYLANQGTLTFHCWLSHADHLRQPDRVTSISIRPTPPARSPRCGPRPGSSASCSTSWG